MDQSIKSFSLTNSGTKYPDVLDTVKGKSFQELLTTPKHLDTAKERFNLQRNLYIWLSDGDDITWEEACLGLKPLPSFTAPSDFYKGLKIKKMPKEVVESSERSRTYALSILNHPERIASLVKAQEKEFKKPSLGHSRVLDQAEVTHRILSFSDVASVQPDLLSDRLHRRKILAQGPFIATSKKKKVGIRMPLTSGSMITGNPEMIASSAMSGVLSWVYKEGLCSMPEVQEKIVRSAIDIIDTAISDDPLWNKRKDKKILHEFWLNQIGITVGAEPEDALPRVEPLMDLISKKRLKSLAVRVYNPQVSKETVETVKELRKNFGDSLEIFAGQANSVEAATELIDAGADAIGQGIAGGLRCTTSIVSGIAVSVLRDLWRMRGKVDAPIFVDSSVSYFWSLAFLLGASMLVKPSHFVGIESIGGRFPFSDGERFYIPYNGEASSINKEHIGKLTIDGKPFAPEGVGGFAEINMQLSSIPDQILEAIINFLVPPFVFQGTSSGRRFTTIEDLHKEADLEFLWELTEESRIVRGAWGPTFHVR